MWAVKIKSSHRVQGHDVPPVCTEEQGGLNQTANDVAVKYMETPKPARLQDHMNPRAGKYIYHTENEYEQELYSGWSNGELWLSEL